MFAGQKWGPAAVAAVSYLECWVVLKVSMSSMLLQLATHKIYQPASCPILEYLRMVRKSRILLHHVGLSEATVYPQNSFSFPLNNGYQFGCLVDTTVARCPCGKNHRGDLFALDTSLNITAGFPMFSLATGMAECWMVVPPESNIRMLGAWKPSVMIKPRQIKDGKYQLSK